MQSANAKFDYQVNLNRKFQTCRYWALGPRCPDIVNGADHCPYAHRDTGRLASVLEQRGTCLHFSQYGFCYKGSSCWYEHRDCGVTGLYQGTIELDGFELEIANAAYKGGFATTNHAGLFDLIWAVKRVAIRGFNHGIHRSRPPRHPIYPDRFRPSGIGDNTARKRKRVTSDPVDTSGRFSPIKFNPVPSLMQKRGTKEDPISLDSDSDRKIPQGPAASSKKRQKKTQPIANDRDLNDKDHVKHTRYDAAANTRSPARHIGPNNLPARRPTRSLNARARSFSPPAPAVASQPRAGFTPPKPRMRKSQSSTAEEKIITALTHTRAELANVTIYMIRCQDDMKAMFNAHGDLLHSDHIMMILRSLSADMNKVWDSATAGVRNAEKAIDWMRSEDGGEATLIDI